jgi:hypothetical protein
MAAATSQTHSCSRHRITWVGFRFWLAIAVEHEQASLPSSSALAAVDWRRISRAAPDSERLPPLLRPSDHGDPGVWCTRYNTFTEAITLWVSRVTATSIWESPVDQSPSND